MHFPGLQKTLNLCWVTIFLSPGWISCRFRPVLNLHMWEGNLKLLILLQGPFHPVFYDAGNPPEGSAQAGQALYQLRDTPILLSTILRSCRQWEVEPGQVSPPFWFPEAGPYFLNSVCLEDRLVWSAILVPHSPHQSPCAQILQSGFNFPEDSVSSIILISNRIEL